MRSLERGPAWPRAALRFGRLAVPGLLAVTCVACGGEPCREAHLRFIDQDPQQVFRLEDVRREMVAFSWDLSDPAEHQRWTVSPASVRVPAHRGALWVVSPGGPLRLQREARLDAATVAEVRLTVRGSARARLRWAGADGAFTDDGGADSLPLPGPPGPREVRLVVPVADHPRWSGVISRLAVELEAPSELWVGLSGVEGVRHELTEDAFQASALGPWKVMLGTDLRNALLAPHGLRTTRELVVPESAELRCSLGLQAGVRTPTRFRALLRTGTDQRVLFERVLRPGDEGAVGRWWDQTVDLGESAGRRVTLELETEAVGEGLGDLGFPVWGNPEVVGAGRRDRRVNVVLISIDTLRADRLSLYGYGRPTSPALDAWAERRAVVFETAVASAPWTLPSHVSIFTGQEASRHGMNHRSSAVNPLTTVTERLRDRGYATAAVCGGGFLRPEYGFGRGFDRYAFWANRRDSADELRSGVEQAVAWLETVRERPFFLFFHTYEVHSPYRIRQPYFARFNEADYPYLEQVEIDYGRDERSVEDRFQVRKGPLVKGAEGDHQLLPPEELFQLLGDLYDAAIAFTDTQLAELLGALERLDLADRTLVILLSDHGEALGEKGLAGHQYLDDFNLLVPLILAFPDQRWAGRRVPEQVRLVDVAPTVLDMVGLPAEAAMDGESLLPILRDGGGGARQALSYASAGNYGLSLRVDGRVKYVLDNTAWAGAAPREFLVDLIADPAEETPLVPDGGDVDRYRATVVEALASVPGVRITLQAPAGRELVGWMKSRMFNTQRVKLVAPAPEVIRWERRNECTFAVPAGATVELVVECAEIEAVRLKVRPAGGGRSRYSYVNPKHIEAGWTWPPGAGSDGAAGSDDQVDEGSVRIWLSHRFLAEDRNLPDMSPDLLEQLRALGYVSTR